MERSKGEEAFIEQKTRQLLTKWADYCIRSRTGGLPEEPSEAAPTALELHQVYFDHAVAKGWIGKTVKDGRRQLTAAGWTAAAAFLKR